MGFKVSREVFIPKGSVKIGSKMGGEAVAYVYRDKAGRPCARVFLGKQAKPYKAVYFRDEAAREKFVRECFESAAASAEFKGKLKREQQERDARARAAIKVGDVYVASWGYDQTNVDFYEVIEIRGSRVLMAAIDSAAKETGFMSGQCVPLPGQRKKSGWEKWCVAGERIKVQYQYARPAAKKIVGGVPVYESERWSSYA